MKALIQSSFLATIFAFAVGANLANAQIKTWVDPTSGTWTDVASWSPNGMPGALDIVRIGNVPAAHNRNVTIHNHRAVNGLEITNGASLFVNSGRLDVGSNIVLSGNEMTGPSELLLTVSGVLALTAENLTVSDGARFKIGNGADVIITDTARVHSDSFFDGRGTVEFLNNTGVAFRNDGVINTTPGYGGMVLNQGGDALFDLDGFTGNGILSIEGGNGFFGQDRLTVNGTQLADSFSGTINMKTASILDMNLSNGWTADANSQINIQSTTSNSDGFARLMGGPVTMAGEFNFFTSGQDVLDPFAIQAEATIEETATFDLGFDTVVLFQEATHINGGTFNTASTSLADGYVSFEGITTWDGQATFGGLARQQNDAIVSGETVIDAERFDMNGSTSVTWDINHSLTVNADHLQGAPTSLVNATLNIGDGLSSRLTINLDEPDEAWLMLGELNLSNNLPFHSTQVSGSRMRVVGDVNVDGAGNRINADTDFLDGSEIVMATSDSSLVMQGSTIVESGVLFLNEGTLINGEAGEMVLEDGVSLDEVGLFNEGVLSIGESAGIADVASFQSTEDAVWELQIGGYVSGDEYDTLLVSNGGASLAGEIHVDLTDVGSGAFAPELGDEFTILTSLGGVLGEFDNTPVSFSEGMEFQWEVLYGSHNVRLRVANIGSVPEPSSISLFLLFGTACLTRRRRVR